MRVRDYIKAISSGCLTVAFSASLLAPTAGASTPQMPSFIRDAEIEGLMRLYTKPIFRAAGVNPGSVRVYLIDDQRINAFVAGGQRIFINTGLLMESKTPNEIIGVLAHETGHIAGGHLARMGIEIDRQSTTVIVGTLLGAAAMAGGAVSGSGQAVRAGTGIMGGAQTMSQRVILNYARAMESSADQAALRFLNATGQSAKGMLTLFHKLANESIASVQFADPYVQTHPMPFERIRNLESAAKASPYFEKPDSPELVLRHNLMQAKLAGFLTPQAVSQRYPPSDTSLPARYARAIVMFRSGDTQNAMPVIDSLTAELPQDPYFWELKGQALLEGGNPTAAVAPLQRAEKLLPNSGLIKILLAQALLGTETPANAATALRALKAARESENDTSQLYKLMAMAYGLMNDLPRAELATAQWASRQGDKKLASEKAIIALKAFKSGTPEWLQANDILNFSKDD